jgi:nucleoside-diphosphate-sugar epimerase
MKKVSILGCGWLGRPLAMHLKQSGYEVWGSATSEEKAGALKASGIHATVIRFSPELQGDEADKFFNTDVLIISLPPKRALRGDEFYLAMVRAICVAIHRHRVRSVLFISSTSAYANKGTVVREDDADPLSLTVRAENILRKSFVKTTVLRFGGLVGQGRHPGRFLSGKNAEGPLTPVNLIHLRDCILIVERIIDTETWGEVFNACADEHPAKALFYTKVCNDLGVPPPHFQNTGDHGHKVVSSEKLKQSLTYSFIYADPMTMPFE